MIKKEHRIYWGAAIIILGIAALTHLELLVKFIGSAGKLLLPVAIGLMTAFVLNVPVSGLEKRLNRLAEKMKMKPRKRLAHVISIIFVLLCVVAVLAVFFILMIPRLIDTIKSIIELVYYNWPIWLETLEGYGMDTEWIRQWIDELNIGSVVSRFMGAAGDVIVYIADYATTTVAALVSVAIGVIIAVYVLFSRDTLALHTKKLIYAYFNKKWADGILSVAGRLKYAYTRFLTGQCVEAVILGTLIFLAYLAFGLPYAALVGVITAVCALIPYVGATVSCVVAVLLTLLVSPEKALVALIVYLVVQFVETQFIYPHVVGGSVGLSALWTLLAVIIGGKLFGLFGMVFFIPLTAVVYDMMREDTNRRLQAKDIDLDEKPKEPEPEPEKNE